MAPSAVGNQAVVVGAGMSGLAAAAAVADYFDQVVVLDRDTLPSDAAHRAGTPQSRHLHALLAGGQRALGELFPGFEEKLARAGAVPLRVAVDVRMELPGFDPFPTRDLGWDVYSMSRPLIERVVRECVQQRSNITLRQRYRVRDLVASADGEAVTAVRYENAVGNSETLHADLIIDASGRGGLTLGFLEAIGQPQPEETLIGVDIGYATAIFTIPDDAPSEWKGVLTLSQAPESSRGALMMPLEGGRQWLATLGGRHGEKPPGDGDGFVSFAQHLPTPTLYNAIQARKSNKTVSTSWSFTGDRWFESISLQRRVSCEPDFLDGRRELAKRDSVTEETGALRTCREGQRSGREVAATWLLCVFIAVLALGATRGLHNSEPPAGTVADKTAIRWHSRAVCTPPLPRAEGVTAILEPWSTISSVRLGASDADGGSFPSAGVRAGGANAQRRPVVARSRLHC